MTLDPRTTLTFIAGADQAAGLPGWREPAAVLELAELAVAEREAIRRDDVLDELYGLPGVPERVHFFSMPRIDISSSLIRRRVAEGRPIRWLVPDAVERAIAERGLYRAEVAADDRRREPRARRPHRRAAPPTSWRSTWSSSTSTT